MTDLSIIIINWNTRQLLDECLHSVFSNLKGVTAEVFVVDNASTDGSVELVKQKYPDAIVISNSRNVGFAAANNQALRIANGQYLLLLNSDTVVHGEVLSRSVEYLKAHSQVGVMGCRVLNTDGTLQPTCNQFPTLLNLVLLTSGLWKLPWPRFFDRFQMSRWQRLDERDVDVVTGCYMMLRTQVIKDVGLLDETFFFFGEETDWCKRIKDAGWIVRFAPVGEITHHGGASAAKLNHKRDILLTEALIHFHRKHGGVISAFACYLILLLFNFSRLIYWTILSIVVPAESKALRRRHFLRVVRELNGAVAKELWAN